MPRGASTRLRMISSPSSEGLEFIVNMLPFKIEIKSIAKDGKKWIAWFTLSDTISHEMLNRALIVIESSGRKNKLTEIEATQ